MRQPDGELYAIFREYGIDIRSLPPCSVRSQLVDAIVALADRRRSRLLNTVAPAAPGPFREPQTLCDHPAISPAIISDLYAIFRGARRAEEEQVPHWDDLPLWIREAIDSVVRMASNR